MAEKELISANAVIGQEVAEFFPKLTLIGEIGLEAKNFSSLDNKGADIRSYGPSLSWSILNFNRIQQRVDAADARTKQAMHNYKKTILQALAEIEGALTRFRTERNRYTFTLKSFQASKKASQIARDQYSVGALPLLDVITAEQSKLELERMLKIMEGSLQISYVELFHAFGRGYAINSKSNNDINSNS
jgi:outer membrane protein TolC